MTQVENRLNGITWCDPNILQMDPKNRNVHPPEQIDQLAKVIQFQGWRWPIVVSNQDNLIKAGHGRVMAAIQMGLKTVPVSYQDFDDDTMAYTFLISDNAIAAQASLDMSQINTDIGEMGPFDTELFGFKDFVVEPIEKLEPGCDEDAVPEHVDPTTKRGDLYALGPHRLLCGDSTSIDTVDRLMGGEKADMVFTDPPYGIDVVGGLSTSVGGSKSFGTDCSENVVKANKYSPIIGDDTTETAKEFFQTCQAIGFSNYLFWGGNYFTDFLPPKKCWLVWDKKGRQWDDNFSGFEMAWSSFDKPAKIFTHVWMGMVQSGVREKRVHPTQKPSKLIEDCLEYLLPGGSVYDGFGGSGSTLIACEKTNRKCFMMELDPHYCDVIVARWEKYSGKKAVLLPAVTDG